VERTQHGAAVLGRAQILDIDQLHSGTYSDGGARHHINATEAGVITRRERFALSFFGLATFVMLVVGVYQMWTVPSQANLLEKILMTIFFGFALFIGLSVFLGLRADDDSPGSDSSF
jgi:hypothetical protein